MERLACLHEKAGAPSASRPLSSLRSADGLNGLRIASLGDLVAVDRRCRTMMNGPYIKRSCYGSGYVSNIVIFERNDRVA